MNDGKKRGRPPKPTVFLSHASANRRELRALKHFLDDRSKGLIEFFLSSDDESIDPGTWWSASVRDALSRTKLMLVFVSPDAVKSSWTYFEAGFGLRQTGAATAYCLPGTEKSKLPGPFQVLHNRNLHNAHDLKLLIQQCNNALDCKIDDAVSSEEFAKIFKKPETVDVHSGPRFDQVVTSVSVVTSTPSGSIESFEKVCAKENLKVATASHEQISETPWCTEMKRKVCRFTTGIALAIEELPRPSLRDEIEITEEMSRKGGGEFDDRWLSKSIFPPDIFHRVRFEWRSVAEINARNAKIQKDNDGIKLLHTMALKEPRNTELVLAPRNRALATLIADKWREVSAFVTAPKIILTLEPFVRRERRLENVAGLIHDSALTLGDQGKLLWRERFVVSFDDLESNIDIHISPIGDANPAVAEFHLDALLATMFDLAILQAGREKGNPRR